MILMSIFDSVIRPPIFISLESSKETQNEQYCK